MPLILPLPFSCMFRSFRFTPLLSQILVKTLVRSRTGKNLLVCPHRVLTVYFWIQRWEHWPRSLSSTEDLELCTGRNWQMQSGRKVSSVSMLCCCFCPPTVLTVFFFQQRCCYCSVVQFLWVSVGRLLFYLSICSYSWELIFKGLYTCLFILRGTLLTASGCFWC